MIPNQKIEVSTRPLNQCHRDYYSDLGYDVYNKSIFVDVKHLYKGSHKKIKIICDYCGEEYETTYKSYNYNKEKSNNKNDCCSKCRLRKTKETMVDKYGVAYALNNEDFLEKSRKTCLERYGEISYSKTDEYKNKFVQTNLKNRGVEYPTQSDEVKVKIAKTLLKNGTIKTSRPQINIFNMLKDNGYEPILNYPIKGYFLDIVIFIGNKKIDIEYDGWYWHQDKRRDAIRNTVLVRNGWNVLRIKGSTSIPTFEQISNAINDIIVNDIKVYSLKLDDWKEVS